MTCGPTFLSDFPKNGSDAVSTQSSHWEPKLSWLARLLTGGRPRLRCFGATAHVSSFMGVLLSVRNKAIG
jgi:hypothetical protein